MIQMHCGDTPRYLRYALGTCVMRILVYLTDYFKIHCVSVCEGWGAGGG